METGGQAGRARDSSLLRRGFRSHTHPRSEAWARQHRRTSCPRATRHRRGLLRGVHQGARVRSVVWLSAHHRLLRLRHVALARRHACGTLLSLVGMVPLSRLRTMRLWMVSIVGALLHEAGQLMVASHLLGTSVVWYLAPVLAIAGCTCGLACGLLAQQFERAMQDTRDANSNKNEPVSLVFDPGPPPTGIIVALVALLVYTVILLRISDVRIACGCVALALVACFVSPVTPHDLWCGIRPLAPLLVCTIVLQLVLSPQTALHESALACTRLVGVSIAATAFMSIVPTDDLTCTVGWALSPLAHLGIDTRGFLVAFDVAVQTVPRLISNVEAHPHRLRDLPGVVIDSFARL